MQCGGEDVYPIITQDCIKFSVCPTMLDTQTVIVLFVLFCKQIYISTCQSFASVIVRSQYSSVTNDLNVVGVCETLTLPSLSITATLI